MPCLLRPLQHLNLLWLFLQRIFSVRISYLCSQHLSKHLVKHHFEKSERYWQWEKRWGRSKEMWVESVKERRQGGGGGVKSICLLPPLFSFLSSLSFSFSSTSRYTNARRFKHLDRFLSGSSSLISIGFYKGANLFFCKLFLISSTEWYWHDRVWLLFSLRFSLNIFESFQSLYIFYRTTWLIAGFLESSSIYVLGTLGGFGVNLGSEPWGQLHNFCNVGSWHYPRLTCWGLDDSTV